MASSASSGSSPISVNVNLLGPIHSAMELPVAREPEQQAPHQGQSAKTVWQLAGDGFSALQLRNNGFTVWQLKAVFSIEELKSARYTAGQLHRVGFTLRELKESGC